jgi:hypothetical protein
MSRSRAFVAAIVAPVAVAVKADEKSYEIILLPEAYLLYGATKQPTSREIRAAVREAVEGT